MTTAAGVDFEAIWANLLAKALEGKDIKELLLNVGAGGGAPAAGAVTAGGAAPAAAEAEAPKEEEKKEEKEESDDDMVRRHFSCVDVRQSLNPFFSVGLRAFRLICFPALLPYFLALRDHMYH